MIVSKGRSSRDGRCAARAIRLATVLLLVAAASAGATDDNECAASGSLHFLCGIQNGEDLVHLPGSQWIVASRMVPAGGLVLIDAETRQWSGASLSSTAQVDAAVYPSCSEPPEPESFVTHGLSVVERDDGRTQLLVVGHGGREAIEIYDVSTAGERPELTWVGCVRTPEALEANSVAGLPDGSMLVTIPLDHGRTIPDAIRGEPTGAVHAWSPGEAEMTRLAGTELPYGNGIEVAEDGTRFWVVTSGTGRIVEFANTRPVEVLRNEGPFDFVPDNLRRGPDGRLLTAGLVADDDECGNVDRSGGFDLAEFAACPRPFVVHAIDPETLEGEDLLRAPRVATFSNVTIGIVVGDELWIGSFGSDRIAVGSVED